MNKQSNASSSRDWHGLLYEKYVTSGQAGDLSDTKLFERIRRPYFDHRIRQHLPSDLGARILELGCGTGIFQLSLSRWGYENTIGIDCSSEMVAVAKQMGLVHIEQADATEYLAKSPADYSVIVMMDLIEHLPKNELLSMLDLVRSRLLPDGRVIIHTVNAEGIFGMRVRYGDLTHVQAFTDRSLRQALLTVGFADVKVFEDRPVVHGLPSLVRRILWDSMTVPFRILLAAESGVTRCVLSQNFLAVASA